MRSVDVREDTGFQARYRRFWALNVARLKSEWVGNYFAVLESHKNNADPSISTVVRELGVNPEGDNPLHFSFASKLVHMVRPERPVYDSLIAAFYFYRPRGGNFEKRLADLLRFYKFLEWEYQRVLQTGLLDYSVHLFRGVYQEAATFSDQKVIDFLLWRFVDEMRNGLVVRGEVIYA